MSESYAASLSKYPNKGVLGLPELFDPDDVVTEKVSQLVELIRCANHIVVHTGAGLSTSAGIPDFRGPNGVWTSEKRKRAPPPSKSFTEAVPTTTHMALKKLVECGLVKFIVSQNIDGLHVRSGLSRNHLAELHGNIFREKCKKCQRMFLRKTPCPTLGVKPTGDICGLPGTSSKGRPCRGALVDMVLDWRNKLPEEDLAASEAHSKFADLNIVLGSTLQIVPAGELPLARKRLDASAKAVIINLQKTKFDGEMDLIIRAKMDHVFLLLMEKLDLQIPLYSPEVDPVNLICPIGVRVLYHTNSEGLSIPGASKTEEQSSDGLACKVPQTSTKSPRSSWTTENGDQQSYKNEKSSGSQQNLVNSPEVTDEKTHSSRRKRVKREAPA